eukprot:1308685-Prymnesium_polylepis.1
MAADEFAPCGRSSLCCREDCFCRGLALRARTTVPNRRTEFRAVGSVRALRVLYSIMYYRTRRKARCPVRTGQHISPAWSVVRHKQCAIKSANRQS